MVLLFRFVAMIFFALFILIFGIGYCLLSPRNPKNVCIVGRIFGRLSRLFGIRLTLRETPASQSVQQAVYIANHQSNWDLITVSNAVRPGTVTVGKKDLVYIPIFGLIYWLSGNILIDRNNRSKAMGTIGQVVDSMKNNAISVWLFPEGTRSRGRGLLPFKTGAFHAAIDAGVPVVPVICSSTKGINISRFNNGNVIVEVMDPISTEGLEKRDVRELAQRCHEVMAARLAEIDAEAKALDAAKA